MAKIVLAIGPTGSGKTSWLNKWQAKEPEKRVVIDEAFAAGDKLGGLWKAIQSGKDVGVSINGRFESARAELGAPQGAFGANEVEIVSFNA